MKQIILKNCKYVTQDKKIPTMKAMLITDGIITASADDFILQDLCPDAEVYDLGGKTVVPAFTDCFGDFLSLAKAKSEDITAAISELSSEYIANGITTTLIKNASIEDVAVLKNASKAGALKIDVAVYLKSTECDELPKQMPMDNLYEDHVRLAGVSVYVDELTPIASLTELLAGYIAAHQQVLLTANSKKTIDLCMSAYSDALSSVNGTKTDEDGNEKPKIFEDLRPIIYGLKELSSEQLTKLQSLGFVPCFAHDRLLSEYSDNSQIYPIRDIVRRGMAFAISQENNISPISSMHLAINRAGDDGVIGSDQTINSDQALMSKTLFASYMSFEDLIKGSLTMTKQADLAILDENPLEISDASIGNIKVCMTVKDGKVYN